MSITIESLEHAYAVALNDIVKAARAVANAVSTLIKAEPEVEALSAVIYPQAVPIERAAFAALGVLAKVAAEIGAIDTGKDVSVQISGQLLADIKALLPAVKGTIASVKPA